MPLKPKLERSQCFKPRYNSGGQFESFQWTDSSKQFYKLNQVFSYEFSYSLSCPLLIVIISLLHELCGYRPAKGFRKIACSSIRKKKKDSIVLVNQYKWFTKRVDYKERLVCKLCTTPLERADDLTLTLPVRFWLISIFCLLLHRLVFFCNGEWCFMFSTWVSVRFIWLFQMRFKGVGSLRFLTVIWRTGELVMHEL